MKSQLLHFDSINANQDNLLDPFSATYPLSGSIQGITKITLKSIELPILFNNIRDSGSLNKFGVYINSVLYSITLPSTNYTSIALLCSDITDQFALLTLPNNAIFVMSTDSQHITVSLQASILTSFTILRSQLACFIMGFLNVSSPVNLSSGSSVTSSITSLNSYNLSIDNYINMTLSNLPTLNNSNASNIISNFKIPIYVTFGQILFLEETQLFKQFIELTNKTFIVSEIKVVITDRFGNTLKNNGVDYSFSLELQNEIVNDYLN
jgi:hypothetical protein